MKTYIVIDMQNDFIDMALGTKEAEAIVEPMAKFLSGLSEENRIIATRDTHHEDYMGTNEGHYLPVPHCIEGTKGWQLNEKIQNACAYEQIVNKPNFGISAEKWKEILGAVDEIVLMGLCTDICVVSNALALKTAYPETRISVLGELCAGVTPESHEAALKTMAMCQVEII